MPSVSRDKPVVFTSCHPLGHLGEWTVRPVVGPPMEENAVWTYEGKELRTVFKSSPNRNGLRIKLRTCGALIASAIISGL
jgi:hypothetical protein